MRYGQLIFLSITGALLCAKKRGVHFGTSSLQWLSDARFALSMLMILGVGGCGLVMYAQFFEIVHRCVLSSS